MEKQQAHSQNLTNQSGKIDIFPLQQSCLVNNLSTRLTSLRDWSKLSNVLRRTAGGCSKSRARSS